MKNQIKLILFALLALVVGIPTTLYYTLTFKLLYNWFGEPAGLPHLSYKICIGLMILWGFLNYKYKSDDNDFDKKVDLWCESVVELFVFCSVIMGISFVWHLILNHVR